MTAKTHLYTFQLIWTQYQCVNTAEYGFGDYPKITEHELATVQAETLMKAQNKFKRMFPERTIIFRVNSPMMAYRVNRTKYFVRGKNGVLVDWFGTVKQAEESLPVLEEHIKGINSSQIGLVVVHDEVWPTLPLRICVETN